MKEQTTAVLDCPDLETVQDVNLGQTRSLALMSENRSAQTVFGTGFTYRHDWGNLNGQHRLTLNWDAITAESRVFVSISEGSPKDGKFIGNARYTLHNVAPFNGGISIWITIEWSAPIRLYADYLVVNP